MKKEFKETPGPWKQAHRISDNKGNYSTEVYCQKGLTIATLAWYKSEPEKGTHEGKNVIIQKTDREANAQLISAAPELLENLIRCIDRLEENGLGNMSAVTRAKEAINKALGL